MNIIVYGRSNCSNCEKLKKRLKEADLNYTEDDIDKYTKHHDGWRDDQSCEILATLLDANNELPVLKINNDFFTCREGQIVLGL